MKLENTNYNLYKISLKIAYNLYNFFTYLQLFKTKEFLIWIQTDFNKEENTLTIFYKIMSKVLLLQSTSSFQIYLFEHVIEPWQRELHRIFFFCTCILKFCNHLCTYNSDNPDLQFLKFCDSSSSVVSPSPASANICSRSSSVSSWGSNSLGIEKEDKPIFGVSTKQSFIWRLIYDSVMGSVFLKLHKS